MASFNQFIQTRVKLVENMTCKNFRKKLTISHQPFLSLPPPSFIVKLPPCPPFTEVRCHALSQSLLHRSIPPNTRILQKDTKMKHYKIHTHARTRPHTHTHPHTLLGGVKQPGRGYRQR